MLIDNYVYWHGRNKYFVSMVCEIERLGVAVNDQKLAGGNDRHRNIRTFFWQSHVIESSHNQGNE